MLNRRNVLLSSLVDSGARNCFKQAWIWKAPFGYQRQEGGRILCRDWMQTASATTASTTTGSYHIRMSTAHLMLQIPKSRCWSDIGHVSNNQCYHSTCRLNLFREAGFAAWINVPPCRDPPQWRFVGQAYTYSSSPAGARQRAHETRTQHAPLCFNWPPI